MLRKLFVALLGVVVLAAVLSIVSQLRVNAEGTAAAERLAASQARSEYTSDELRADIAALHTWLNEVHPTVIPSFPLGDIGAALQVAKGEIDRPLDQLGFYRRIAPVVNELNDEHTMVFPPERNDETPGFPFEVVISDNRIFAWREWRANTGVARGDELLSINGIAAGSIIESISAFYSGTTTRQKQEYAAWGFANALPQVLDIRPPFELRIRVAETGTVSTLQVPGVERSEELRPAFSAFSYEATEPKVMRFTFNAFDDEEGRFDEFLENIFGEIRESRFDSLIIDLRRNQGGASEYGDRILDYLTDQPYTQLKRVDITVSDLVRQHFMSYVPGFARWLPVEHLHPFLKPLWASETGEVASIDFEEIMPSENPLRFDGDVYVLIGPGTMSSASLFAAAIKHYGIGILIGEETGGYATMYGNIVDARLPNTGLKVWMPTSVVYGQAEGPVVPDHHVAQSIDDLARSKDTVVDYTLRLIAGN